MAAFRTCASNLQAYQRWQVYGIFNLPPVAGVPKCDWDPICHQMGDYDMIWQVNCMREVDTGDTVDIFVDTDLIAVTKGIDVVCDEGESYSQALFQL